MKPFPFFRAYYRANENKLPQKVLVYRDGVGAGDIQRVLEIELHGINVRIIIDRLKNNIK